jgi:lysophospholipase L1-like esterase
VAEFADQDLLRLHYKRHRDDFGAASQQEYAELANIFLSAPITPRVRQCIRNQGDLIRYDTITDEFGKQRPKAKILLLGIFPRSAKPGKDLKNTQTVVAAELQPKIAEINEKIAKFDDGKRVKYLDISKAFLNAEGGLPRSVMPDFLHLSEDGYSRWAKAIETVVPEMIKK